MTVPLVTVKLSDLQPGQGFTLAGGDPIRGEVVRVSEGWVLVKVRGGVREVEIHTSDGQTVSFEREKTARETWARGTRVHPEVDNGVD